MRAELEGRVLAQRFGQVVERMAVGDYLTPGEQQQIQFIQKLVDGSIDAAMYKIAVAGLDRSSASSRVRRRSFSATIRTFPLSPNSSVSISYSKAASGVQATTCASRLS